MILLLVDGHNLLFRAFHGIPARITGSGGQSIHAVVGVMGMLLRIVAAEQVDAVLVVFDNEEGSFRDDLVPQYKGGRLRDFSGLPKDQNPFEQLAPLKSSLDALRWRYCEVPGLEADDVIAGYTRMASTDVQIVIASGDRDMLQLVNEFVTVVAGKTQKYGPAEVVERYGVTPSQLPLLRALSGDPSDNWPGIKGVGLKLAQRAVQGCCTVDELYQRMAELPLRVQRLLVDARPEVKKGLELLRLERSAPIPFGLDELRITSASRTKTMDLMRMAGLL